MNKKLLLFLVLLHLGIGLYYSGWSFIQNMDKAIPMYSSGGGTGYMQPGDHLEQFYRYSLVKNNIKRGYSPYYSGYQYNLDNKKNSFSEGLIFFPFSMLNAIIAGFVGDVAAYNIMAILSYILCGVFSFLFVFQITKCVPSSLLASVYFSTFPFRTSFLYGEMVYGVDLCLVPLCLYFFECYFEERNNRYIVLFFASLFCLLTANIQIFYFFMLFGTGYFFIRYAYSMFKLGSITEIRKSVLLAIVASLPVWAHVIWKYTVISQASGLQSGQNYSELLYYAPSVNNLFQRISGNEKNVYLGLLSPLVVVGSLFGAVFYKKQRGKLIVYLAMFLVSYGFIFGPVIDSLLGKSLFHYLWETIPGFSSSRTIGRIMSVSLGYFIVVLAITFNWLLTAIKSQRIRWILTFLAIAIVMVDFNCVNPTMCSLDGGNRAYAFLEGKGGNVFTVPIAKQAANYENATFLYYALKYDLSIYGGHSSLYPKDYNSINKSLIDVNNGELTKAHWQWLRENNYKYLVVHSTDFKPKVSKLTLIKFLISPYLDKVITDNGIYVFKIKDKISTNKADNFKDLFLEELQRVGFDKIDCGKVYYLNSWYARESYPGQIPFRWMHGVNSSCLYLFEPAKKKRVMQFSYISPHNSLKISVNGERVNFVSTTEKGWSQVKIPLASFMHLSQYLYIEFSTSAVYKVPSDKREFGCMISDIVIR